MLGAGREIQSELGTERWDKAQSCQAGRTRFGILTGGLGMDCLTFATDAFFFFPSLWGLKKKALPHVHGCAKPQGQ